MSKDLTFNPVVRQFRDETDLMGGVLARKALASFHSATFPSYIALTILLFGHS
jgi:hypothetical protein